MNKSWHDTMWVSVINIANVVVTAVLFLKIANVLGPDNYGLYVFAMSVGMFAALIDGFGGEYLLVMFGSRDEKEIPELFGNALLLRLILMLPMLIISYLVAVVYQISNIFIGWYMTIVFATVIKGFVYPLFISYYRVINNVRIPWLSLFFCNLLFLVYVFMLKKDQMSLGYIVMGYLLSNFLLLTIFSIDLSKRLGFAISLVKLLDKIKFNRIFLSTQIVDLLFSRVDIFVIQAILGTSALGIYSVGYKIPATLIAIPSAFHMVMLPLFHKSTHQPRELLKLFNQTRKFMIEISAFVLGFLVYNGIRPFEAFLTIEYKESSIIVSIIAVYMMINFIAYPYAMLAEAENKIVEKLYARIYSLVFATLVIVPAVIYGGNVGVAIAVTGGMLLFLLLLHRKINIKNETLCETCRELYPFSLTVLAGMCEYLLRPYLPTGLIGVIVSIIVYSTIFLFTGYWMKILKFLNIHFIFTFPKLIG